MNFREEIIGDCRLILGDCLEVMPTLDPVDLILTDPPYGTTQNRWDSVIPFDEMWGAMPMSNTTPAIITATQPFSSALVASNFYLFKYQWVWVKTKITGVLNAKRMPVRKHEQVLVFYEKPPTYNAQGLVEVNRVTKQGGCSDNYGQRNTAPYVQQYTNWPRDVLEISSEGKNVHPTQKPVALMEYFILTYTNEGDTVLDFCMGSGTTGIACANTGRKFIGIELDEKYFDIAVNRMTEQ